MDRKISELDQVLNLDEQAEFPLSQDNGGTPTTFKAKLTQLAAKIAEAITFSNLITNDKHIIGAINEAAQGSGASMKFEDLNDVDINNLQDGQFSKYDSTSEKWKNTNIQESDVTNLVSDLADKADKTDLVYEKTASGSIATFNNGGDDIPVSEFECEIVAQQASGTPTPVNPLAITGFSQADISVSGKNFFPSLDTETKNGFTVTNNNGVLTLSGTASATTTTFSKSFSLPAGNYNLCALNSVSGGTNYRMEITKDGNQVVNAYLNSVNRNDNFTLTEYSDLIFNFIVSYNTTGGNYTLSPQITLGSGAQLTFNPYKGNLYTVAFGQTIYGGRLIYKNGQWSIEATHAKYTIDSATALGNYATSAQYGSWARISSIGSQKISESEVCAISSYATGVSYEDRIANPNIQRVYIDAQGYVVIRASASDNITTESDLKTLFTGADIVYELATPTIIPITSSTRVKTISGNDNIYSNTGDCEVKYFTNKADSLAELVRASENESTVDYHEYSTEEQIVGKWIDGRTVYEKTLNVGTIGSGTTFSHGITNLDWIIDYSIFGLYAGQNKLVSPANGSSSSIGFVISGWDSTNITFTKGNLSSNFSDCYCTIRYIKSTSNNRSLNLSKGVEEKTEEIKTEEVKEEEKS